MLLHDPGNEFTTVPGIRASRQPKRHAIAWTEGGRIAHDILEPRVTSLAGVVVVFDRGIPPTTPFTVLVIEKKIRRRALCAGL